MSVYFHNRGPVIISPSPTMKFATIAPDIRSVLCFFIFNIANLRGGPRKSDSRIRCKIRQMTRRSHRNEQDKEEQVLGGV